MGHLIITFQRLPGTNRTDVLFFASKLPGVTQVPQSDPLSGELPILRGTRVYLRAAERSDVPTFTRWFNDARVARFLAMDTPFSLTSEEGWFDRLQTIQ